MNVQCMMAIRAPLISLSVVLCMLAGVVPVKLSGQTPEVSAAIIALCTDTSILVRWAPENLDSWEWGKTHGYMLTRYITMVNGTPLTDQQQYASKDTLALEILPLPNDTVSWIGIDPDTNIVAVAEGALYDDSFVVDSLHTESDLIRAYSTMQDKEGRFIYGLFAADQSFAVAVAMGLGFEDTGVDTGKTYRYVLEFNNTDAGQQKKRSTILIKMGSVQTLPVPQELDFESAQDSVVLMSWSADGLEKYYVSYNVERSDVDSTGPFNRINAYPLVFDPENGLVKGRIFYSDKVGQNDKDYWYRVQGVTPFGIRGPYSSVEVIETKRGPKASAPAITSVSETNGQQQIDWDFPSGEETFIHSFRIYRASIRSGPFELVDTIANLSIRTWTDTSPLPSGYYRVVAYDKAGAEISTGAVLAQLMDETPPGVVENVSCTVSESGLVTVSWSPVTDADLEGYRVFMANLVDDEYSQVTSESAKDTFFMFETTLETLTHSFYVKVQTSDFRENYSAYSTPCPCERPDMIPPAPPLLFKADPLPYGIRLEWMHSQSADVSEHRLQRKTTDELAWTTLLTLDGGSPPQSIDWGNQYSINTVGGSATDTTASHLHIYNYRVLAEDHDENVSSSEIRTVRPYDSGQRGTITNFDADDVTVGHDTWIELTWDYDFPDGLYQFQIYRAVDKSPMTAYATTNGRGGPNFSVYLATPGGVPTGDFSYDDKLLGSGALIGGTTTAISGPITRKFRYRVQAIHSDGGWSAMSDEVEVVVEVK